MEPNPFVERAIDVCGLVGLAKAFEISPQAVDKWRRNGVPAERVLKLETLSGISRSALRPDLYPPETKSPSEVAKRKRA